MVILKRASAIVGIVNIERPSENKPKISLCLCKAFYVCYKYSTNARIWKLVKYFYCNWVLMIAFEYNSCYYTIKLFHFIINIFISRESRAHNRERILLITFDFISRLIQIQYNILSVYTITQQYTYGICIIFWCITFSFIILIIIYYLCCGPVAIYNISITHAYIFYITLSFLLYLYIFSLLLYY